MATNIYKEALIKGLRFSIDGYTYTTEQLWGLPLQAPTGPSLDRLALKYNELKTPTEPESFVNEQPKRAATKEAELQFDIVKDVIDTLKARQEAVKSNQEKALQRAKLLEIKRAKEAEALKDLTLEEIEAQLAELGE